METTTQKHKNQANGIMRQECPVCDNSEMRIFFEIESVPVFCNVLWDSRSEAMAAPLAQIYLAFCHKCGLIYNIAFDRTLMDYSPAYENSLHFSQLFQQWADETADRLVQRYQLREKDVIEIGCGQGDFLAILQHLGNNRVLGFDPSYDSKKTSDDAEEPAMAIIPEAYSEIHSSHPADFICCRHVLEHIDRPLDFLKGIRKTIGRRKECIVYFEVPNALYSIERMGLWDIIYEHCSYFTSESLANLFLRAGFEPIEVAERYEGQFLTIDARPGRREIDGTMDPEWIVPNIKQLIDSFQNTYKEKVQSWRHTLSDLGKRDSRTVIWGAGSKGVTFVNALGISHHQIEHVVDVNPRKCGKFVPGMGQSVVAPDLLKEYHPGTTIIMNPIYQSEIQEAIREFGLETRFLFG